MDLSRPFSAVSPSLDGAVLNALARTSRPLSGREVARLAGQRSHSGVLKVLGRLVAHGLVDRQEAANAQLFTLNREHLAAPAVQMLADMRAELLQRLRTSIKGWEIAPAHASLFGSGARGQGDTRSDIDIFAVRPVGVADDDPIWRDQIDRLANQVHRWAGNHASVAEVALEEFGRLREEERPILDALRSDAITLSGPPIEALLGQTA